MVKSRLAESPKVRASMKRALDLGLLALSIPVTVPLGFATALAVRVRMGPPILFKQRRLGQNETEFSLFKFRTMTNRRGDDGALLPDEGRLTPTGRIMRRTSLDELPQLINVLRGEMSIVGPRPLLPQYRRFYTDRERLRHSVKPGITGLAQVSGRNNLTWAKRLELDAQYAESAGPLSDLWIIARTLTKVLGASDVVTIAGDSGEPLDVERSYPQLDGYRLRRLERYDIPHRVRLFNDPRIRLHMTLPEDVTPESTHQWLSEARKEHLRRDFVVERMADAAVVAMLGIRTKVDLSTPEMYILVDPTQQGKGLGSLSIALLLTWMKRQHYYRGCTLTVAKENAAAVAMYRRAGFYVTNTQDDTRYDMATTW